MRCAQGKKFTNVCQAVSRLILLAHSMMGCSSIKVALSEVSSYMCLNINWLVSGREVLPRVLWNDTAVGKCENVHLGCCKFFFFFDCQCVLCVCCVCAVCLWDVACVKPVSAIWSMADAYMCIAPKRFTSPFRAFTWNWQTHKTHRRVPFYEEDQFPSIVACGCWLFAHLLPL